MYQGGSSWLSISRYVWQWQLSSFRSKILKYSCCIILIQGIPKTMCLYFTLSLGSVHWAVIGRQNMVIKWELTLSRIDNFAGYLIFLVTIWNSIKGALSVAVPGEIHGYSEVESMLSLVFSLVYSVWIKRERKRDRDGERQKQRERERERGRERETPRELMG